MEGAYNLLPPSIYDYLMLFTVQLIHLHLKHGLSWESGQVVFFLVIVRKGSMD